MIVISKLHFKNYTKNPVLILHIFYEENREKAIDASLLLSAVGVKIDPYFFEPLRQYDGGKAMRIQFSKMHGIDND